MQSCLSARTHVGTVFLVFPWYFWFALLWVAWTNLPKWLTWQIIQLIRWSELGISVCWLRFPPFRGKEFDASYLWKGITPYYSELAHKIILQMLPPGDWHCPNCTCKFCGLAGEDDAEGDDTTTSALLPCSICEKKCISLSLSFFVFSLLSFAYRILPTCVSS